MKTLDEPVSAQPTLFPVQLTGVGHAVPATVLSNDDLAKLVDTNDEWIKSRTGIAERRVVAPGETLTSLCVPAARDALAMAKLDASALDLIIVATSSPDHPMPSTAALVQAAIGASRAAAFDLEAACSGYVYGLVVAAQFIGTGLYRNVLVLGADVLSRFMDYTDRGTCILFGDGAGATVLQRGERQGLLAGLLGADGHGAKHLDIAPNPDEPEPPARALRQSFMHMNGREVYKFAADTVPKAIEGVLAQAGLGADEVDYYLLHQANYRILEAIAKRLGVDEGKMLHNLEKYGNTSAASIPLLFSEAIADGTIRPGQTLCMVGFGAGLTWAAALVRWG